MKLFRKIYSNQRGLTLIELLAAMTILGIVFFGFLSIFPQMTKFNAQTDNKLEAMNLARKELELIKTSGRQFLENEENYEYIPTSNDYVTYKKRNQNESSYVIEVDFYEQDALKESSLEEGTNDNFIKLNKIHVKLKKGGKVVSETFGYIQSRQSM